MLTSILPDHVGEEEIHALEKCLADVMASNREINRALDKCNLQPTSRAFRLAAISAVSALLAHEIGTEAYKEN